MEGNDSFNIGTDPVGKNIQRQYTQNEVDKEAFVHSTCDDKISPKPSGISILTESEEKENVRGGNHNSAFPIGETDHCGTDEEFLSSSNMGWNPAPLKNICHEKQLCLSGSSDHVPSGLVCDCQQIGKLETCTCSLEIRPNKETPVPVNHSENTCKSKSTAEFEKATLSVTKMPSSDKVLSTSSSALKVESKDDGNSTTSSPNILEVTKTQESPLESVTCTFGTSSSLVIPTETNSSCDILPLPKSDIKTYQVNHNDNFESDMHSIQKNYFIAQRPLRKGTNISQKLEGFEESTEKLSTPDFENWFDKRCSRGKPEINASKSMSKMRKSDEVDNIYVDGWNNNNTGATVTSYVSKTDNSGVSKSSYEQSNTVEGKIVLEKSATLGMKTSVTLIESTHIPSDAKPSSVSLVCPKGQDDNSNSNQDMQTECSEFSSFQTAHGCSALHGKTKSFLNGNEKPFLKSWEEKFIAIRDVSRNFEPQLQLLDNHVQSDVNGNCSTAQVQSLTHDVYFGVSGTEKNNILTPTQTENKQSSDLGKYCNVENHQNSEPDSSTKDTDPFELSAEDDNSQERYQPVKRKSDVIGQSYLEHDADKFSGSSEKKKVKSNEVQQLIQVGGGTTERQSQPVMCVRRVTYIHSDELMAKTNKLVKIEGRAKLVHSLISAYGLLKYCHVVPPRYASESEIFGFHSPDYINFLRDVSEKEEDSDSATSEAESYGLAYDCPIQEGIFNTVSMIAGATIVAAESLINESSDLAINWYGGWHHGKRDSASGFCYINDIVLGILKLREKFDKILYVDLDLHHGDGVEEAFSMTNKVMTVSFHKCSPGFFPGSGAIEDVGTGRGKYYTLNVPLLDGLQDSEFTYVVFKKVMTAVLHKFKAEAIVIQCGADGMAEDPMNSFNLTHVGIARCVDFMLSWKLPTLLLGGGGYNFPNTARCWTYLTSLAVGKKLPVSIPEHEHFLSYSPLFELVTHEGNRKDWNTKQYIQGLLYKVYSNLRNLKD